MRTAEGTAFRQLVQGGLIAADNVGNATDYIKAVTTDPQLDTVFFGRFAATMKKR